MSYIRRPPERKPAARICLGKQHLLCDKSYEFGEHKGLGLIHGEIVDIGGLVPAGIDLKNPAHGLEQALTFRWDSRRAACLSTLAKAHMFILFTLMLQSAAARL
jgi:hypothetical protein